MFEWYELWDTRNGDLINEYTSREDAFAAVRWYSSQVGNAFLTTVLLARGTEDETEDDDVDVIAHGAELRDLAWRDSSRERRVEVPGGSTRVRVIDVEFRDEQLAQPPVSPDQLRVRGGSFLQEEHVASWWRSGRAEVGVH